MRFNQLKKDASAVIRKKMYKSGKTWVIASILSFAGVAIIGMGNTTAVKAEVVNSTDNVNEVVNSNNSDNGTDTNVNDSQDATDNGGIQNNRQITTGDLSSNNASENQKPIQDDSENTVGPSSLNLNSDRTDVGNTDSKNITTPEIATSKQGTETYLSDTKKFNGQNIVDQGKDGSSQYYYTDAGTLYFLDGQLDNETTRQLTSRFRNGLKRIDTSMAVDRIFAPEDSSRLFSNVFMANTTYDDSGNMKVEDPEASFNLSKMDTSKTTNMESMFSSVDVPILDLSNFDTSKVTTMDYMFSSVKAKLNISTFDTLNVTDMEHMFEEFNEKNYYGDSYIKNEDLDLSTFNTSKVTNMENMFSGAYLRSLNVSSFDTSNADIEAMFQGTTVENGLNVSNFKENAGTGIENAFNHLVTSFLDMSGIDMHAAYLNPDLGVETAAFIFDGSQIAAIKLGPKNAFGKDRFISLPTSVGAWTNVGAGTIDNPEGIYSFTSKTDETGLNKYYDYNAKLGVDTWVPYVKVFHDDVNVPTTIDGKKFDDVIYKNQFGQKGHIIKLNVPEKKGYKADKSVISAMVNDDGTITTKDIINYTTVVVPHNGGSNNSSSEDNDNHVIDSANIETLQQTIATFADEPIVELYALNQSDDSMSKVSNRGLAPDSGWYSDEKVTIQDITYLRVATNEWARADQVYRYVAHKSNVLTNNNSGSSYKRLLSAEDNTISNRSLGNGTTWYTDRIAYLGKNADVKDSNLSSQKYYRVATNEFVSANDVSEY